jgi:phosphopantothenoylcysteine decarboxylase/phosphopantothenate--cysteine ligase
MYNAAVEAFSSSDIAIMAAAVADYRPKTYSDIKIKKKQGEITIELERTKDIAAHLGSIKKSHQLTIGFALETTNEEANAKRKLEKKNFDMIVLNSLKDKGAGFQHNTNKVKIINTKGDVIDYELKSKRAVAEDIVNQIVEFQK